MNLNNDDFCSENVNFSDYMTQSRARNSLTCTEHSHAELAGKCSSLSWVKYLAIFCD